MTFSGLDPEPWFQVIDFVNMSVANENYRKGFRQISRNRYEISPLSEYVIEIFEMKIEISEIPFTAK